MDEIKEFKSNHNGDFVRYSNKELIGGLHTKIDNINIRLADGDKKIAKLQTHVFWLKTSVFAIYAIIGSVFIKPIREFLQKLIGG